MDTLQTGTTARGAGSATIDKKPVLITGGTGKTGSRVAQQLMKLDWPIRIGSRNGDPAFDWLDTRTWAPALQGMDAVYISYQPDLAIPGSSDAIRFFTQVAIAAGVRKLVLLSGRGEPEAQACEEVVMQSGADWTILRASWFCQNFSEGFLLEPIQAGHLVLPPAQALEPFIDIEDIADVAVAALTTEVHKGELYELSGPRMLSFREAVSEIGQALNKEIVYEEVSLPAYAEMLEQYGVPANYIGLISYLFSEVLDGRNEYLADGVQRALGRAPRDFSDFVRRNAESGIWG